MPPHTDPQGRLKITSLLNPLNLVSVLAGPHLARECFCCICVFVLFVAWIQILPAISSIITLLDKLPHQIEDNILWIMLAAVSACCLGCCRCYVKVKVEHAVLRPMTPVKESIESVHGDHVRQGSRLDANFDVSEKKAEHSINIVKPSVRSVAELPSTHCAHQKAQGKVLKTRQIKRVGGEGSFKHALDYADKRLKEPDVLLMARGLPLLPNMWSLKLDGNKLSRAGLKELCTCLPMCGRLQNLSLSNCSLSSYVHTLGACLPKLPHLSSLSLAGNSLDAISYLTLEANNDR